MELALVAGKSEKDKTKLLELTVNAHIRVSDQRRVKVPGCVGGLGWSSFPA